MFFVKRRRMDSASAVPQPQGGRELDEFVVLLFDDLPVDRAAEDRLKIGVLLRFSLVRPVEPLLAKVLQPR